MSKIQNRTKFIRYIKYSCIFISIITALVVVFFIIKNQNNKIRQDNSIKTEISKQNHFHSKINKPDLVGINLDNGIYYIKAEELQEISNYYDFKKPIVNLMLNHQDWLDVVSETAKLIKQNNLLQLFGNVRANFNKIYYFEGNEAEILKDQSIVRSNEYSKIFNNKNTLESDTGFILDYNAETMFFFGKINANLKQKNDITNIQSNKFNVYWEKKEGHFIDNVILTKKGTVVNANKMVAILNAKTDELEKIYAFGNVKITDDENVATGNFGEYIVAQELLTLKSNVTLHKGANFAKGELLHYNFKNHKANLIGSTIANEGRVKAIIIPKKND